MKKCIILSLIALIILLNSYCASLTLIPQPNKLVNLGESFNVNQSDFILSSEFEKLDKRLISAVKDFIPEIKFSEKEKITKGKTFIHITNKLDEFVNANIDFKPLESADQPIYHQEINPSKFIEQEYFLYIKKASNFNLVLIIYSDRKFPSPISNKAITNVSGAFYAIKTLKQIYKDGALREVAILDKPAFPIRGVLEGFYGRVWDSNKRLQMIKWMADNKYNLFLYTPKDDPTLRFAWRNSLSKKEVDYLKEIISLSKENFIEYCWGLSPGMSIRFSREKDLEAALNKYKTVIDAGGTCFTLAFDDVGTDLIPPDNEKYKNYWSAQVDFANRLLEELIKYKNDLNFAFVPNDYWGSLAPKSEYLRYVGKHLDKRYKIGWTGLEIGVRTLPISDPKFYSFFIKRTPMLGDNYPVMDNIDMSGRLHLGPLRGRDSQLYRYIELFASNAMPLPHASKLALLTIIDFSWNPTAYDPDESLKKACQIIGGKDGFAPLYLFAKQSESSFIWEYESLELSEAIWDFWHGFNGAFDYNFEDSYGKLKDYFVKFSTMEEEIKSKVEDKAFVDEILPWLKKLDDYGNISIKLIEMIKDKYNKANIDFEKIKEVQKKIDELNKNKAIITRKVMDNFLIQSLAVLKGEPIPAEIDMQKSILSGE